MFAFYSYQLCQGRVRGLWLCDEPEWECCCKVGAKLGLSSSLCLCPSSGYSLSSQTSEAGYQYICILALISSRCCNTSTSHLLWNLTPIYYNSSFPLLLTNHFHGPDSSYRLPASLPTCFKPCGCWLAGPQVEQSKPWWFQTGASALEKLDAGPPCPFPSHHFLQ